MEEKNIKKIYTALTRLYEILKNKNTSIIEKIELKDITSVNDVKSFVEDALDNDEVKKDKEVEEDLRKLLEEIDLLEKEEEKNKPVEEIEPVESSSLDEAISSLNEACDKYNYVYSLDVGDDNSYDSFSIVVSYNNQETIDALIASFHEYCDISFEKNSNDSFTLNITNTGKKYDSVNLLNSINNVIESAREDVNYLDSCPEEVRISQLKFMTEHPEVCDNYYDSTFSYNTSNERGEMIYDAISTNDRTVLEASNDLYSVSDENNNENIVSDTTKKEAEEVQDLASNKPDQIDSTINSNDIYEDNKDSLSANDIFMKASIAATGANVVDMDINMVLDVINTIRNEGSSVDIYAIPDMNSKDTINLVIKDTSNQNAPFIVKIDKDEYAELRDNIIHNINYKNVSSETNEDSTCNMVINDQNDDSTYSEIGVSPEVVQEAENNLENTNGNAYVYKNETDKEEAAFSSSTLLVIAISVVVLLIVLLILILK